jgi:hypothetical protein
MNEKDLDKLMPNIRGQVPEKVERELYLAFRRLYEYIDVALNRIHTELSEEIKSGELSSDDLNSLIGAFSQPLVGSSTVDPLLQSIIQSFGPQAADTVFSAPAGAAGSPLFQLLSQSHIPNLNASKITTGTLALARLDTKILQTPNALTKTIVGAPYANDGFVNVSDNAGNSVKLMTTA